MVTEEEWRGPIGQWVRAAVDAIEPGGPSAAERYTRLLTQLAVWGQVEGLPLDIEVLLDPLVVERFVKQRHGGSASAATYRSDLRRIGRAVTRRAPWEAPAPAISRRKVSLPYSSADLSGIWRDADRQPSPARRRAARAVFLLGVGAGLDGRWIPHIAGTDVVVNRGVVAVMVPQPDRRRVVVWWRYADDLLALARSVADEPLLGTGPATKNRLSRVTGRLLHSEGVPPISAGRLRSTWLVNHLSAGTRLPELAEAAGLQGITVISDLLRCVEPLPHYLSDQQLKGAQ